MILYSWEYQNKFFIMYKRFLFIVKSLTKMTIANALKKSWKRKNFREIPRSKLRFEKVIFDCSHGSN